MICTTITTDAFDQTYRDVKQLLHDMCHRFIERHGSLLSLDELYSEACLAFVKAYKAFDPSYGNAFTTLLVSYVRTHLFDAWRRAARYCNRFQRGGELDPIASEEPREFWTHVYDAVSEDTQTVLDLVLNTPNEIQTIIDSKGGSFANIRSSVREETIKKEGWNAHRFRAVVDEIREVLQ